MSGGASRSVASIGSPGGAPSVTPSLRENEQAPAHATTTQPPRCAALIIIQDTAVSSGVARILFPLPDRDFDVTEVAVPWKLLVEAGHEPVFATEAGATPACDPLLISGVVFGLLGARDEPIAFYRELEQAASFARPLRWSDVDPARFDALFLAGGHARGMRQYLGSEVVQRLTAAFFADADKPIGAICHGVLVAARATADGGRSVLHGHRTTCLPKYMERSAYLATFWRRGRYYRTYPAYVEDEVRAALAEPAHFELGPKTLSRRGTRDDDTHAFVVEDGRYISARWPGDAYLIAKQLIARLPAVQGASRAAPSS
ncbi:MAG: DJ-1/PfpI family protein [Deltaproteobacteria bacterium]|nr:DJ-1/PfpI family protein [Deltaproteobacteria bacterium]